jgi:hypothetical protein
MQWVRSGGGVGGGEGRLDMLLDPYLRYRAYKLFRIGTSAQKLRYENSKRMVVELVSCSVYLTAVLHENAIFIVYQSSNC